MMYRFGGGFGLLEVVWVLLVVLVWIGVIAAIVLGIRWLLRAERGNHAGGPPPPAGPRPDDPLEILRQRYARGEIDDEEFERRKRTLGG